MNVIDNNVLVPMNDSNKCFQELLPMNIFHNYSICFWWIFLMNISEEYFLWMLPMNISEWMLYINASGGYE